MSFQLLARTSFRRFNVVRSFATIPGGTTRFQQRSVSAGTAKVNSTVTATDATNESQVEQASGSEVPNAPTSYGGDGSKNDWSRSYHGLSSEPFPREVADVLLAPIDPLDIEIKTGTLFSVSVWTDVLVLF